MKKETPASMGPDGSFSAEIVMLDRFSPGQVLDTLARKDGGYCCTVFMAVPAMYIKMIEASGQTGEIRLKGPGITPGYWRNPRETAKAFENGWFKTGDLGYVDPDGYYYLTDRIKNIIISGGENISPKEVETVINQMDGVLESVVVGIPDEKWGEKVVAAVKCRPGKEIDAAEIQRFCRESVHDWKTPREFRFVGEIPKNRMGKVLNDGVRRLF